MYCKYCGSQIDDNADVCVHCGRLTSGKAASAVEDKPNAGLNVIGFCWPFVGLILYLVMKEQTPNKAKAIGKWALISVCVYVGIFILYIVIVALLIAFGVAGASISAMF